jgi:RNA polymerase sigma factor (TIGR02999 family)
VSPTEDKTELTVGLLRLAREGNDDAKRRLLERVYREIRALARRQVARVGLPSMQGTDIVHDAVIRLLRTEDNLLAADRAHLIAIVGKVMRNLIIDKIRRTRRHGEQLRRTSIDLDSLPRSHHPLTDDQLQIIDDALGQLEKADPLLAQVVELRFFAGLTFDEVATSLGLSRPQTLRRWERARRKLSSLVQGQ